MSSFGIVVCFFNIVQTQTGQECFFVGSFKVQFLNQWKCNIAKEGAETWSHSKNLQTCENYGMVTPNFPCQSSMFLVNRLLCFQ